MIEFQSSHQILAIVIGHPQSACDQKLRRGTFSRFKLKELEGTSGNVPTGSRASRSAMLVRCETPRTPGFQKSSGANAARSQMLI